MDIFYHVNDEMFVKICSCILFAYFYRFHIICCILLALGAFIYVIVEIALKTPNNLISLSGMVFFILLFYIFSYNPARVSYLYTKLNRPYTVKHDYNEVLRTANFASLYKLKSLHPPSVQHLINLFKASNYFQRVRYILVWLYSRF